MHNKKKKVTLPTNIVLILLQPNIKNNNYREYQSRLYSQTITNKEGKIGNDYFTFDLQTSSSKFEKVVGFDHQQALLFQNTGPPIRVINANERDNIQVFVNNTQILSRLPNSGDIHFESTQPSTNL